MSIDDRGWQRVKGWDGGWLELWECEHPGISVRFEVFEDEWVDDTDPPRQIIHKVRLVDVSVTKRNETQAHRIPPGSLTKQHHRR